MQEHEKFGAPPKLRPRTAGASRSALPPSGLVYGTSTSTVPFASAPEQLASSVNAHKESSSLMLRQRLQSPRPGSAAPHEIVRPPGTEIRANNEKGVFMKPPMRPKSATAASRQVSRHRIQLVQDSTATQPANNQSQEAIATASDKEDALRLGVSSATGRLPGSSLIGKRPFSASPFCRPVQSNVSNQVDETTLFTSVNIGSGMKRPHSAAASARFKSLRARDKSESALSSCFSVASYATKSARSGSASTARTGQSRGDRLLASTRQNSDNTFVYGVPRHLLESGLPYNPYDITPVTHEELFGVSGNITQIQDARWDFYTISRTGYTYHIKSEGFRSTFLSLGDWEAQKAQFAKLRGLSTFSGFRYRKVFMCWRQYVQASKREAIRNALFSKCYFSIPVLQNGMQEIHLQLSRLSKLQLMWDFDGKTSSLEHFTISNAQFVRARTKKVAQITTCVQRILERICRDFLEDMAPLHAGFPGNEFALSVQKSSNFHIFENYVQCEQSLATAHQQFLHHKHFRFSQRATSEAARVRAAKLMEALPKGIKRAEKPKLRAPVQSNALEDIRWTMAAIRRRKCKQLTKFVTLVDFLLLDACALVITRSLTMLYNLVMRGSNATTVLRLCDHDDITLAMHRTLGIQRKSSTQTAGETNMEHLGTSQPRQMSQEREQLTKQQIKTFLHAAWEGKLYVSSDFSSSTTAMESKLETHFFDALAKHAGTNADGYSVNDLVFVAENALGKLLVLPPFAVTDRSVAAPKDEGIRSQYSATSGQSPLGGEEKLPSLVEQEVMAIPCLHLQPLFTVSVGTDAIAEKRNSRRRSYQICFQPELPEIVSTLQATIRGFTEAFREVPSLLSSPDLRSVFEFSEDIRALKLHSNFDSDRPVVSRSEMASSVRRNSRAPGCEEPENNNRSSFDEDDERFKSLSDRLLNRTQGDQHDLSVCYEIEDLVRSALHGAEILASDYTKVLELRQQNESIDFELKAQLFRRGQYTLDNIKEDADNFTGQISALESLTKSTIVEFLHFDMDQLQAELLPSPAKCLDSMRDLLPRLLREKCDKFLQYVSTSSSRIEKPVTQNLDAFTTYLLNIREVFEEVLERESDLAFLYDFFRLLDKLKFKAPLDTTKVFELCGPEFQALKVQVQEAYANRDSDLQSYMPLLTENLSQLGRRTSWLQSAASEQAMTAPTRSSQEARDSAMKLYEEAQQMQQDATKLVHIQQVFEEVSSDPRRPRKTFEELDILSTELRLKSDVWQAVCETDEYLRGCSTDTLHSIDLDKMSALASRVDSVIENTRLNASQIADSFEVDRLEKLQTILHGLGPVIRDLRNPHFAERHWTKLEHKMQCSLAPPCAESEENARAEDLAGTEPLVNNRLSLQVQQLLEVGAVAYATTIRHVSEEATAEAAMAGNFMRVVSTWETTQIPVESRKDRDGRDVHCIGDCIELDALIEESQVLLRVMDLSTYSLVVQDRLPKMISDLELTKGSLELLQICQRQWEYTQRLVSVDFARTFPDQAKKLQKHDTAWRSLTQGLFNRSLCLPFGVNTENREALEAILEGFEAAAKTLSDHLEIKRQIFPAFFQLSDLELATLLSKCRDVNCISAFLFQCFDNVGRIVFGTRDAFQDILQVTSRAYGESEMISMGKNLKARGPAEQWLSAIEKRLAEQLRRSTKQLLDMFLSLDKPALSAGTPNSKLDISHFPIQSILLADRVVRCTIIENGLRDTVNGGAICSNPFERIHTRLAEYSTSVSNQLLPFGHASSSEKVFSPREITLRAGLRLQEIQFRDALANHVSSQQPNSASLSRPTALSIDWEQQLQYRMDDATTVGHECYVQMNTLSIPYGFSYSNPLTGVVVTPSSLRSLFSLFACIRHAQGCILTGPSESGKRTLSTQVGSILGRRVFTATVTTYKHAVRLLIGALYAGGVFCARVRIEPQSRSNAEIIKTLATTLAAIEHAVLTKNAILNLHRSPITFVPGTTMLTILQSRVNLSMANSEDVRIWTEPFSHFVVTQWDWACVLEAVLHCKNFAEPRILAKRLLTMWHHARSSLGNVCTKASLSDEHPFSFLVLKTIITDVAFWIEANVPQPSLESSEARQNYQWFLIHEALLRYFRDRIDAESLTNLEGVLNYTSPSVSDESYSRYTLVNANQTEPPSPLQEYILVAARELHYVPRRVLIESVLSLSTALASSVSAVLVGPSGVGKTASYQVLAKAIELSLATQAGIQHAQLPVVSHQVQPSLATSENHSGPAKINGKVVFHVVLPMALTVSQLYGGITPDGHGRIPSIFGQLFREAQEVHVRGMVPNANNERDQQISSDDRLTGSFLDLANQVWVVFDDALDLRWLEGLLAVLSKPKDSVSRLLAFEDGEFMTVPPNLRFLFEVLQLRHATPSFVRLNAILPFREQSHVEMVDDEHPKVTVGQDISMAYLHRYFAIQRQQMLSQHSGSPTVLAMDAFHAAEVWLLHKPLLAEVTALLEARNSEVVNLSPLQRVANLTSLLQALLSTTNVMSDPARANGGAMGIDCPDGFPEDMTPSQIRVEMALMYSLLWGFAACTSDRPSVQRQVSDLLRREFEHLAPAWLGCGVNVNLFETIVDLRGLRFISVVARSDDVSIQPQVIGSNGGISSLFIPTTSSLLAHTAIKEALRSGRGVLLLGGDTARRTTLARNFLGQLEVIRSIIAAGGVPNMVIPVNNKDAEKPRKPIDSSTDEAATLASVMRLRLRQITLVTRLAKRLQKDTSSARSGTSQPSKGVSGASANATDDPHSLLPDDDDERLPLVITPTMDRTKATMVRRFDRGDIIPFFFVMPTGSSGAGSGEAASELASCLERMLQRERTGIYEPPPGKTALLILDDLHLAIPSDKPEWQRSHQPVYPSVHSYLRSVHEHKTVYRGDSSVPITVENLMLLTTMRVEHFMASSPTSGSDESLQKLTSQFFPVLAPSCGLEDLYHIFGQALQTHWTAVSNASKGTNTGTFTPTVRQTVPLMIAATTVLWDRLREKYCFRLQDLVRVYEGLAGVGHSMLGDVETLLRLWTHECSRTLRESSIGPVSRKQDSAVAEEIVQMRALLSQVSQRRASARASRLSLTGATFGASSMTKRNSVKPGPQAIDEQATVAANLALFAARSTAPSSITGLGVIHGRPSQQFVSLHDQEHRTLITGGLWAFVPAGVYYSGSSTLGDTFDNGRRDSEMSGRSSRRSSASFMLQKSLEATMINNTSEGEAPGRTHAKSNRWIYAEVSFEDDTEAMSTAALQPYFGSIRTFSSMTKSWCPSKAVPLPRDVPPVPFALARSVAQIDRIFARPAARLILLEDVGSAGDTLLHFVNALRIPDRQDPAHIDNTVLTFSGLQDDPIINANAQRCMALRWKRVLVQLYDCVGVSGQEATLVVKRIDLLPPLIVNQLQALMTTGEVSGMLTLGEQIQLATRVLDERLLDLKAKHAAQVDQIRSEAETTRDQALAALQQQQREAPTTPLTEATRLVELRYQRELRSKLARVELRWQQDTDDLMRAREVESESVAATVMALTRPLGVTSGKWASAVARVRSKLRVVLIIGKEHEKSVRAASPNIFSSCDLVSVPKLDRKSLRTLVYGHFHAQVQQLLRDHTKTGSDKQQDAEEGSLTAFLLQVQRSLWTLSCMATDMHLAVVDAFLTKQTGDDVEKCPPTARAFAMALFFAKLLVDGYEREEAARARASWFLDLSNRLDRDLGALRSSDAILSEKLTTIDQQLKSHQAKLVEQKQDAERIRAIMQRFQSAADEQVQATNEAQALAQKELREPMACLEEANRALLLVDRRHIVEIKSFVNPPPLVHLVLGAVCILFQLEPSWESARRLLLGDANVVQTLLQFDKDAVPPATLAKLEAEYLRDERFTREEVERQSVAASSMVGWVRAIHQYATARRQVQPTLDKLEKAQSRLQLIMQEYQVSKQRVVEADTASQATQSAIDADTTRKKALKSEIASLNARCDNGGRALEALQEDRKRQQEAATTSTMRRGFSLTSWNTLLAAGSLAYACEISSTPRRQHVFEAWETAYYSYGGLTPGCPPSSTCCVFIPSISVALKRPTDSTEEARSAEDGHETPLTTLFDGDYPPDGDIEAEETLKLVTGVGQLCFSRRRLWDATLLSMVATTSSLSAVMITRYSADLEKLLVSCARRVWHWRHMHMVYARAADFDTVFRLAAHEGHQLLVLDVEPLDTEPQSGEEHICLHSAISWKTRLIDGTEHLLISGRCPAVTNSEKIDCSSLDGIPTTTETIALNPDFRLILTSHATRTAFGDALDMIPTLDAKLHESDIADVMVDNVWSNTALQSKDVVMTSGGSGEFTLKTALREHGRLVQQYEVSQAQVTKQLEAAAVTSQFPLAQTKLLRERLAGNQEARRVLGEKRREIQEQLRIVKHQVVRLAQAGAAVFNAFNAIISRAGTTSSPPLTLHGFLPIFFASLTPSTPLPNTMLAVPLAQTPPTHTEIKPQGPNRRMGILARTAASLMLSSTSRRQTNSTDIPSDVLTKLLTRVSSLILPASTGGDWHRFLLRVIFHLEEMQPTAKPLIAKLLEEVRVPKTQVKDLEKQPSSAARSVGTILLRAKLRNQGKHAPMYPGITEEECKAVAVSSSRADLQRRVVGIIMNGCKSEHLTHDVDTLLQSALSMGSSRCERLRVGLVLFPELVHHVCDRILTGYGVSVQSSQRAFNNDETNPQEGMWLRIMRALPEQTAALVLTRHEFHSFAFARRIFFHGLNDSAQLQVRVLQELAKRTFRAVEKNSAAETITNIEAKRAVPLDELYVLPRVVYPPEDGHRKDVQHLVLTANNFRQIEKMEKSEIEVLEAAPLAVVNMKRIATDPEYWEALFKILHRSCQRISSTTFLRHPATNQATASSVSSSPTKRTSIARGERPAALSAVQQTVSAKQEAARRTSQSMTRRFSALDLVTPTYPRLVAVVDDWCALPVHLRTNVVCFHDEYEEEVDGMDGDHTPVFFGKCLQSTILRLALYPCAHKLSELVPISEDDSVIHGPQPELWQVFSGLVMFHSALVFRERTLRTAYAGALSQNHQPSGTGAIFHYSDDVFLTAINQATTAMKEKQHSYGQRRDAKRGTECGGVPEQHLYQKVVLSAYARLALGHQEEAFLKRLFSECLQLVCWATEPGGIDHGGRSSSVDLRSSRKMTVRGDLLGVAASSPVQRNSIKRSSTLAIATRPLLLGFLAFPREDLSRQSDFSLSQWLEFVWTYSVSIDRRTDGKLQAVILNHQLKPDNRRGSLEESPADLIASSSYIEMPKGAPPKWMRHFGWVSKNRTVLSDATVDLATIISVSGAIEVLRSILAEAIPPPVGLLGFKAPEDALETDEEVQPGRRSLGPQSASVELVLKTIADAYNLQRDACYVAIDTLLSQLVACEQSEVSADVSPNILAGQLEEEEEEDDGATHSETEDSVEHDESSSMLLIDIEDSAVRHQVVAILRNDIPMGLLGQKSLSNTTLPPMAPTWSLHDVVQHYRDWHRFFISHQSHDSNDLLRWWLPGVLASELSVSHVLEISQTRYRTTHPSRNWDPETSVQFTLRLPRSQNSSDSEQDTDEEETNTGDENNNFSMPEDTFAIFDGLVLLGATWNQELQCLDSVGDSRPHQRVELVCSFSTENISSSNHKTLQNPKQPPAQLSSLHHVPLFSPHDGSLLLECAITVNSSRLNPLATVFMIPMGSFYR